MKQKFYLLIFLSFLFATLSFAQSADDDNIEFLRVQTQITNQNYTKALEILSGISEQGKENNFYLSYSAECHEHLKNFDSAEYYYRKLYAITKTFDVMKKVADMKDKKEARQACSQCHGTGYYYSDIKCNRCSGTGSVKCRTCKGEGKLECTTCDGTGQRPNPSMYGDATYECPICHGNGKKDCYMCKGSGEQKCISCDGNGTVNRMLTCQLHD